MEKKTVVRARGIILDGDELLVVKHSPSVDFVALPGGHLEWGENIKECLERELIEELGVKPLIGRLLYVNNFVEHDITHSTEFFFEVLNSHEYKNIENLERTHAHELAEMHWIKPTDTISLLPQRLWEAFKTGRILSDQVRYIHD